MRKYDAIIIGSGLGGLACAHILSSEGYRVLVLERGSQPGGCMQSYRRHGLEFDTGLHYVGGLGEGQPLWRAFRLLRLLHLPWVRLDTDCFDRIHIGGESYDLAQGYDRFARQLERRFPSEGGGLRLYVDLLKRTAGHQLDWIDPAKASDNAHGADTPAEEFSIQAWQWLNEHIHDPQLINVISGNSTRVELRKDTLPLFTFAHINSSFVADSRRLRGTGRLIVESLLDDIRAHGGELRCNTEVTRLVERDGRIAEAVSAEGESFEAGLFISDIHPMLTYDLIGESHLVRRSLRHRMHLLENTYGILTVSLVIKPGLLPYVGHNDYIYARPNVWDEFERDKPVSGVMASYYVPTDGSSFVRQIDLLTPVRWDECRPWSDTRVGHRGASYAEWKRQKADECVRLASTVIPHLPEMIEARYTSTPLTYRDYTLTPDGSAYGLRKDCGSAMLTVLSPRTPEPNLLLTGQSLVLHGVEGVTMTALMTCAEVLGKERVWQLLNPSKSKVQ